MHDRACRSAAATPLRPEPRTLLRSLTEPARYATLVDLADCPPDTSLKVGPGDQLADRPPAAMDRSADLVLSGGLATAVAAPSMVCALAQRYAFRRIGGASAAALAAAAAAAAELGRAVASPAETPGAHQGRAARGFPGLAETLDWLASPPTSPSPGASSSQLTGLLKPGTATRGLHQLLLLLATPRSQRRPKRILRIVTAAYSALGRAARTVVVLLWLGAVLGCVGTVAAVSKSPQVSALLVVAVAVPLAATFALAATCGTGLLLAHAVRGLVRDTLVDEGFGLCPGADAEPAGSATGGEPREHSPALFDWLADRLDDLAGLDRAAEGSQRYALTFGELWLGRAGIRSGADLRMLRRAACRSANRVVDLILVTTDLSVRRPWLLPFGAVERPEQRAAERFLFCRECLLGVVPVRVIDQMLLMSPPDRRPSTCPRHEAALHDLPAPWDLPVAFAVRLAAAVPGVLTAVPLYRRGPGGDVRLHWFGDGNLAGGMPVDFFDVPLPRWPTFSLGVFGAAGSGGLADGADCPDQDFFVPEQATEGSAPPWRDLGGRSGPVSAVIGSVTDWRNTLHGGLPGLGARLARVRGEGIRSLLTDPEAVARLAVRGYEAGRTLRERFGAADGPHSRHTQTDRLRWIRLRTALAEYRQLSLSVAVGIPLFTDLALAYRVPEPVCTWFSPPLTPGQADPAWGDAVAAMTHLRSLADGGVLDWDTDWGAPPPDPHLRLC